MKALFFVSNHFFGGFTMLYSNHLMMKLWMVAMTPAIHSLVQGGATVGLPAGFDRCYQSSPLVLELQEFLRTHVDVF